MSAELDESIRDAITEAFAGITPLVRYNAAVTAINEATASVLAIPGLRKALARSRAFETLLPLTEGRVWTADGNLTCYTAEDLYDYLRDAARAAEHVARLDRAFGPEATL